MTSSDSHLIDPRFAGAELAQVLTDFNHSEPTWFLPDCEGLSFYRYLNDWHGWDYQFVARVIGEYKRFLSLVIKDEQPVIPPASVDILWRLHRQYSACYEQFCQSILLNLPAETDGGIRAQKAGIRRRGNIERALREHDLRAGKRAVKFLRQYRGTLGFYVLEFGKPPADIWGPNPGTMLGGW